ncbi:MAG: large subunit ribosomal protein [Patescibacteria group bacterium]|nr:large subunit ribosomal protein [Patescibacteria group bacterium]
MTTASFAVLSADMKKRNKIDITPGNTVRVFLRIQEKGKTRLQAFEGLVIARKHGSEAGATFTVRKVASGVGMEKTFPLYSPVIDKIEIVKKSKVRRSKLYYIRDKAAKEIRRRMKQIIGGKKDDALNDEEEVIEVLDSPDINPEEVIVTEEETPEVVEATK